MLIMRTPTSSITWSKEVLMIGCGTIITNVVCFESLVLVAAQAENNLALSDTANFLDAGLTALGLLTALVITIMRGRLDAENGTRDLLTFLAGNRLIGSTRTLVPKPTSSSTPDPIIPGSTWYMSSGITTSSSHLGSQALVIVEEASLACARQMFGYYACLSGKTADIIPARWLHRASKQEPSRCNCPTARSTGMRCKCLVFTHVDGVAEHLSKVAEGACIRLDDDLDALMTQSCCFFKCHGYPKTLYNSEGILADPEIATSGTTRAQTDTPGAIAIGKCVSDLNVEVDGMSGFILIEGDTSEGLKWSETLIQASVTRDASDRGTTNAFVHSYKRALEGVPSELESTHTMRNSPIWLSRLGSFLVASVLVLLFRTDPFSSILLARRTMRAYILDSTATKLPLEFFLKQANVQRVEGETRAFIVFKRKDNFVLCEPRRALFWMGAFPEALVVVMWLGAVAAVPWFHPTGGSYVVGATNWALLLGCIFALFASCINAFVWSVPFINKVAKFCIDKLARQNPWSFTSLVPTKRRTLWGIVALICAMMDMASLAIAVIWVSKVDAIIVGVGRHWLTTIFRWLLLLAALLQWWLGVETLDTIISSSRGQTTMGIVPYALTFFRLLALVAGAGKWA